jgi:agmatinase
MTKIKAPSAEKLTEVESAGKPDETSGLFGLDFSEDESLIQILGVPWDLTASYHRGTARTPFDIIKVSHQLDLEDPWLGRGFERGINYTVLEDLAIDQPTDREDVETVNLFSAKVNTRVREESYTRLQRGARVGILGGDHSVPLGLISALAEKYDSLSILHIDAHHDLRKAYEEYTYSHASIFHNVMADVASIKKLVSVGIRDYSSEEVDFARSLGPRHQSFYDADIKSRVLSGTPAAQIIEDIVNSVPEGPVYFSVDIDGLDPTLCPGTGTPVPGGLDFDFFSMLCQKLLDSKRHKIVGFDLCEVCASEGDREWNLNVGARVLYKLCCLLAQQK